ncbi:MAG: tRNA (adenosine(37)-N6)-threonylcarbamoyltransferase complex dimerization subunit type 1 TsaB [Hoeflea sp.]|uniref:tRNA (adenosine(37)-N6)-threonylcarbamoyltransferase complex dimerization subunit type 1 TsaB n=1 Tax=Hoeflea sp. TaxID=1940281 RepID=UPI001D5E579D|nr:tRNA (adenosine(37)-N6)-threonylcarbamoyltransferase complex dimerization subunit type 1 TsaB [Hoeflea sp.]MBU4531533.1 tRNA (adenosine(37)-N6)-threonylcarbamoyltransferase complex dimerization subunit type 1 TsaB [Alphaproteobacteria bacterium]MBU4544390.1 tRNA (adenosine(37)-N6)-threonylcarbamoyltransferase complex dimerization subunit type 1 TsaB [Alphaproteobacteria bacterium]MBU4550373.1 tRNA (adenosine(37)-N6)-threonylcarbamoyltransferase complex dimerization subunit type 1 TsaB [Alphap
MLTLALDCSARFCAAALYEAETDRILASASPDIGRGHAEQLPAIVEAVLAEARADLSRIERIGVTVGPGSFAGIRVGVAFARGLSLSLNVPCVGVGSLEAIAIPAARETGKPVMAVLDAKRDHVWALLVDSRGAVLNPAAELAPAAAASLALKSNCGLIGSGALLLASIDASLASRIIADPVAPTIEDVARIAARLEPGANLPEPRYLRDADAKPQLGFAVAHEGAG